MNFLYIYYESYIYTEKSFDGQPRLENHALSQQNKLFSLLKKSPLCFVSLDHCFYAGDSFQITFLFIPNKAVIVTGQKRRETCRSICKALLGGMVGNKHGSHIGKQVCLWQDKEKSQGKLGSTISEQYPTGLGKR